jgi:CheY-like chemotaxis protein
VEPSAAQQRAFTQLVGRWGMKVETASDATRGLERLSTARTKGHPFALVVAGPSAAAGMTRAAQTATGSAHTALVVLAPDASDAASFGADRAVATPVRATPLRETLSELVGRAQLGRDTSAHAAASAPEPGERGHVLVAEDDAINQMVIQRVLKKLGYTCDVSPDGASAVKAAAEKQYDAILMDCRMPGVDGFEATIAIRAAEPNGRRLPIVAVTADALSDARERCLAAGMDAFLTKPVVAAELSATLRRLISQARQAPAAS